MPRERPVSGSWKWLKIATHLFENEHNQHNKQCMFTTTAFSRNADLNGLSKATIFRYIAICSWWIEKEIVLCLWCLTYRTIFLPVTRQIALFEICMHNEWGPVIGKTDKHENPMSGSNYFWLHTLFKKNKNRTCWWRQYLTLSILPWFVLHNILVSITFNN